MSDEILVRTSGRATEIVLNRPDAGNAVTNEMAAALESAIAGAGRIPFHRPARGGRGFLHRARRHGEPSGRASLRPMSAAARTR